MANEPLLWLKFTGEQLDVRSVPIYELGDTLVALQRIVHKVFLHDQDRLRKGAHLTRDERQRLSLQIFERQKSSDLYALIPFIADTVVQEYVASLIKLGLSTLAKYALQSVIPSLEREAKDISVKKDRPEGSLLIGAIYAETVQITNHIHNIGGVETIEMLPAQNLAIRPVKLTADTQDYVRRIANETYYGKPEEITGQVTKLHPNRLVAEIKIQPGRYVKVKLNETLFRFVRYETEKEERLRFKGRPIIRLGKDAADYKEFEAESVESAGK